MGLDMYLSGRTFFVRDSEQEIDGFPVEEIHVKLGYWRKDWTLHHAFCAVLENECEGDTAVSAEDLRRLLGMIQSQEIKDEDGSTYTGEGCADYGEADTLDVLSRAIEWIEKAPQGEWRDAIYRGSW